MTFNRQVVEREIYIKKNRILVESLIKLPLIFLIYGITNTIISFIKHPSMFKQLQSGNKFSNK